MEPRRFWEEFSFSYTIGRQSLFNDLISIEAYRQAALNLVLAPEWREQLDRLNRVRAVHGTTAIEGNPLSEVDVAHQLDLFERADGDQPEGQPTKEQLQVRNAAEAQAWIKVRFGPGSPPVKLEDILTAHKLVTRRSDETNNIPGRLRTFPVQVGTPELGGVHRGAPHETLPDLMQGFVEFVNSAGLKSEHPVVQALLAHFFLVTIHPFGDGNGRVSRLLEAGILFQSGHNVHGFYGLSNFFYRNQEEYRALLQQCRRSQPPNVTPFVAFGVRGFADELAGINSFVKTKVNRVLYRQMLLANYNRRAGVRRRLLNLREYQFLVYLLNETEPLDPFSEDPSRRVRLSALLESDYVKAAYRDVTQRTFVRELTRLAQLEFIIFQDTPPEDVGVEIDFGAIGKYPAC